jgi:hypothetical protein
VTSSTIAGTRRRVDEDLVPAVAFVRELLPETVVDGHGFGGIGGLLIGGPYEEFREWADTTFGDADFMLTNLSQALERARRNWRAAEDASIVRYRSG